MSSRRATGNEADYDLVVIGGNAGGLSVAISSLRSGLKLVRIVESDHSVVFPDLVGPDELDIGYGEIVSRIDTSGPTILVETNKHTYRSRAALIAERHLMPEWTPPVETYPSPRIRTDSIPDHIEDSDVLVVGFTDHAVELTARSAAAGARVVLAAGGMNPSRLSPAGAHALRRLERERRATILYQSTPNQIVDTDGYPMAYFGDRRTPDLQFDHVVFASHRKTLTPDQAGLTPSALESGLVWFLGEPDKVSPETTAPGWRIGLAIAEACFPELELSSETAESDNGRRSQKDIENLRSEYYNATITSFEPTHSDLWVLRVRPDHGLSSFIPGQYASLGLGYWEPRIDEAEDADLDERWNKLVRRSYSISSRMFDPSGYLTDEGGLDELEFYIVLVPATDQRVPGLTPRLALKRPGDRIYLGPKVAGRYTLAPITDPSSTVLFLSTGTGEAPHNAMAIALLRKGHYGPIVSVVSVRRWDDLGYLKEHQTLAERYVNYHYLPMPTREPDVPKRYIQDVLMDGDIESMDIDLNPASTHVFLCGNPSMIGIPDGDGSTSALPERAGVVPLLVERGFKLDERKNPGNIHVEEYW